MRVNCRYGRYVKSGRVITVIDGMNQLICLGIALGIAFEEDEHYLF